jgi:hypothetical protein
MVPGSPELGFNSMYVLKARAGCCVGTLQPATSAAMPTASSTKRLTHHVRHAFDPGRLCFISNTFSHRPASADGIRGEPVWPQQPHTELDFDNIISSFQRLCIGGMTDLD